MGPAIDNGPAARAMAVATGRQSRKILRMRGRQREKHCRTRPRPPGSVVAWSGMEEGKIRGHHHWAQINVNLADIFNGTSLALGRSLSLSLTATEEWLEGECVKNPASLRSFLSPIHHC